MPSPRSARLRWHRRRRHGERLFFPMRAVIAHFLPLTELTQRLPLPGRDDDLLCLGNGHAQLAWEPTRNSYDQIASQFPPGWKPDAYLHWSLEYNPVPKGLEEADCYTVGIVGD